MWDGRRAFDTIGCKRNTKKPLNITTANTDMSMYSFVCEANRKRGLKGISTFSSILVTHYLSVFPYQTVNELGILTSDPRLKLVAKVAFYHPVFRMPSRFTYIPQHSQANTHSSCVSMVTKHL